MDDVEYTETAKNEYETILRITRQYKYDKDCRSNSGWDRNAQRGYEMVFGNQWPASIRSALHEQERPALVFNLIRKATDVIVGHMIQNNADLVVLPVDREADPYVARLLQKAIKNIEHWNHIGAERKAQFIDGWITGVGVKEKYFDTSRNIDGDICLHQIPSTEIVLDPTFRKYDYTDAMRLHRDTWLGKDDIARIYGKKFANRLKKLTSSDDIGTLPSFQVTKGYNEQTDYGNRGGELETKAFLDLALDCGYDVKNNLWRVIESYERTWIEHKVFFDPELNDYRDIEGLSEEERAYVNDMTITRHSPVIHLTTIIADMKAEDKDTDAEEFNQLFDFYFPFFINGFFMGGIQNLIDPQMEVNKRYSTIIDILTRIANSGIFYKKGIFDKEDQDNLKNLLAQNGTAIGVDELYDEHGHRTIEDRQPPQVPPIYERMMEFGQNMIEYISSAVPAMQGNVPRKQTGVAKRLEINQASIGLLDMMENFRATIENEGRSQIWMIQKYKTDEWIMRIYGDTFGEDEQEIALNKRAAGMIFNDVSTGKYDVVLSFEGKTPTERESTYWKLIEFTNAAPMYAQAVAPAVLDLLALPEKDKIKKRMAEIDKQQQALQAAGVAQQAQGGGVRREPQKVQA